MSYEVVSNRNFSGGLNLRDKADVVKESEAIDLLNVDLTDTGAIKQRNGYLKFTPLALANRAESLYPFSAANGLKQLLAGSTFQLDAINDSGNIIASVAATPGATTPTYTRFAAPGSEFAFVANSSDTIKQWNGATWNAPTGTVNGTGASALPKAGAICVTPNTNRLVATAYGTATTSGPGGTASSSNPSRVHFSNIGDPFTWETDGLGTPIRGRNYVDLTPGDGEKIMNCVAWRDKVFVFKESKFFVFEGEGINNDSTPIFRYRAVDTGIGLAATHAICTSRSGVFFLDHTGLYFTNGGDPSFLSDKIDPFWIGGAETYFQSHSINQALLSLVRMVFHDERVYISVPTGTSLYNDRMLVYDIQQRWWTLYDIAASALTSWERVDLNELHFAYATGTKDIAHLSTAVNTDDGVAITSRWRSGWSDFGIDLEKTIRQSRLWGTGIIRFKLSRDFSTTFESNDQIDFTNTFDSWGNGLGTDLWQNGTNSEDLWGSGNQVTSRLNRSAVRGTVFSMEITNDSTSSVWSLHRVGRHIREQRPAGIYTQ